MCCTGVLPMMKGSQHRVGFEQTATGSARYSASFLSYGLFLGIATACLSCRARLVYVVEFIAARVSRRA